MDLRPLLELALPVLALAVVLAYTLWVTFGFLTDAIIRPAEVRRLQRVLADLTTEVAGLRVRLEDAEARCTQTESRLAVLTQNQRLLQHPHRQPPPSGQHPAPPSASSSSPP